MPEEVESITVTIAVDTNLRNEVFHLDYFEVQNLEVEMSEILLGMGFGI